MAYRWQLISRFCYKENIKQLKELFHEEKGLNMIDKDYQLECNYCCKRETINNRKMYKIEIGEILLSGDYKYPHKDGQSRFLQICEHCFKYSSLNEVLNKESRNFR